MNRAFSSYRQYSIPVATIDPAQVRGYGGASAPVLTMSVRLDARFDYFKPREAINFRTLRATISLPPSAPGAAYETLVARDAAVDLFVSPRYASRDHQVILEFPLSQAWINLLERHRNGGDLRLRLRLMLETEQLHAVAEIPNDPYPAELAWAFVQLHRQSLDEEFTVLRSTWVEYVLPQIGYGKVHLIEMPAVPLEEIQELADSYAALQQAQALHRIGHYDDAVGKCRVAMDKFFQMVDGPETDEQGRPKRIPKLKAKWEIKLGRATHQWLDAAMIAVKDATNKPHHSPNAHYDQFQSQMLQMIVATLISYAARQGIRP